MDALPDTRTVSQTCFIQPIPVPPFASKREWESRSLKSSSAEVHLHGCASDQVFGEVLATTRFIRFGSSSSAPFEGLHCVHLPASSVYDYIKHTHEMSRVNGVIDALSIGPSAWYFLFSILVHVSFLLTAYATSGTHMHIHVATYITLVF
jgi:hypothetical protein